MCCDLSLQKDPCKIDMGDAKEEEEEEIKPCSKHDEKREKREKKEGPCPKGREKGERWSHTKGVHKPFHHIPSTYLYILIRLYDLYSIWIRSLALQYM
jgi:hypothetical protein